MAAAATPGMAAQYPPQSDEPASPYPIALYSTLSIFGAARNKTAAVS